MESSQFSIVSARLKLGEQVLGQASGYRSQPMHVSVISVCAPTHQASQEEKDVFYEDLQRVVDGIGGDNLLLILGDFNARVGSGERGDAWEDVLGCHGVGRVNENGEALLSWCAQNEMVNL